MKLSKTERWILSNQYRILEALYPDEAMDLTRGRKALEMGYELEYSSITRHIIDDADVMSGEECREILDILTMFSRVHRVVDGQSLSSIDPEAIRFHGFDGNHEGKQLEYAEYFCVEHDRFSNIRPHDFNCHTPMMDRYRRQLVAFNQSADKAHLAPEDIERIASTAYLFRE